MLALVIGAAADSAGRGAARAPPAIVLRLNAEVNRALRGPEMRQFMLADGAMPAPQSAAQFAAAIAEDISRRQKLARQQSITVE